MLKKGRTFLRILSTGSFAIGEATSFFIGGFLFSLLLDLK
jgi:hypothetical protein